MKHLFEKSLKKTNFLKIRSVGAELFQGDGRTDMTRLITFFFRSFANPPKKSII